MMELSRAEKDSIIRELTQELRAKKDGSGKNLIARCPFCGKEGKYGIYIGQETERKKTFMSNCFSCGHSTYSLHQLLEKIGRTDLMVTPTTNPEMKVEENLLFRLDQEEVIDDTLGIAELPEFYKRSFSNSYLKSRGFVVDDYEYFPVGTTKGLNRRFDDYVIFPITDAGDIVGYVARHTWGKPEIDEHNRRVKREGNFKLLRYRNSTVNDFVKLLYNFDGVFECETDTVVVVEGVFDVVALTRKLEWYDNRRIAAVATFGKKISLTQIYKLQTKGVRTVVIGYDGDAVSAIQKAADTLSSYFDVLIADIADAHKDWEDLCYEEIYDIFTNRLQTPLQYKLIKVQE